MTDILFVNQFDWDSRGGQVLPIGLLSLNQVLLKEGFKSHICDYNSVYARKELKLNTNYYVNQERMIQYLLKYQPRIVSIYTMANNYHTALSMCTLLKKANPETITILAGPQATALAEKTLKIFPDVDLIGMGEGELTICGIVKHLSKHGLEDLDCVKGICYRNNGIPESNWDNSRWIDVDDLPIIDFSPLIDSKKINTIEMEIGRGCPFSCTYCSTSVFWGRNYRVKSPKRVLNEVKTYIKIYGIKTVYFRHDLFTCNKQYVLEICNLFIENDLQIEWACYARLDVLDEEMISMMAQAGCRILYLGLESGSARIQRVIDKNLQISSIFPLLEVFNKYQVSAHLSFIFGFPEETHSDLAETLNVMYQIKQRCRLLRQNRNRIEIFLSKLAYFPGTRLTKENIERLEYDSSCLENMNHPIPVPQEVLDTIQSNKDIYPQYFNSPKLIENKYLHIPAFMHGLLSSLYNSEYEMVDELIERYSGDILLLYENIYSQNHHDVKKIHHISLTSRDELVLGHSVYNLLKYIV